MSIHNIGFYAEKGKLSLNYHQISNTHLISSAGLYCLFTGISPKNYIEIKKSFLMPLRLKVDSPN